MTKDLKKVAILVLIDSFHCDTYTCSAALYRSFHRRRDKYQTPSVYLCSTYRVGHVVEKILFEKPDIAEIHFAGSGGMALNDELLDAMQKVQAQNCCFVWYSVFPDMDDAMTRLSIFGSSVRVIKGRNSEGSLERMFYEEIINKDVIKSDPVFTDILWYNNGERGEWKNEPELIRQAPDIIKWAKYVTDTFFWDAYNPFHIVNFIIKLSQYGKPDRADKKQIQDYLIGLEDEFVTRSRSGIELKRKARILADKNVNVIISGESGTGKELLVRDMKRCSKNQSFSIYNCATIPDDNLAISALFGHVKGAYTGCSDGRDGIFKSTAGGTIVLDEVQELSLPVQARLLRTLESWTIQPLGADREVEIKPCRVICITNADIKKMVEKGQFRKDLWYRIADVVLEIPPLRERPEDISIIFSKILETEALRLNTPVIKPKKIIVERLSHFNWPGNGREIRNAVRRAYALEDASFEWVQEDFPVEQKEVFFSCDKPVSLERIQALYAQRVFEYCNKNKTETQQVMGMGSVNTLNKYLEAAKNLEE